MNAHKITSVVAALSLASGAAACGGGASAGGASATGAVSTGAGATTVTGSAAGHSFSAQIASITALLQRVSALSGSAGSQQLATRLGDVRQRLSTADQNLKDAQVPSALQDGKQQLDESLQDWNADLAAAQQTAQSGDTQKALSQATSSTYDDLRGLVQSLQGSVSTAG